MTITYSKRILISAFLIFAVGQSYAQNKDAEVSSKTTAIGLIQGSGQPINAVEYQFPVRIQDFSVDTITRNLTVQLRGLSNNGKWLENKGLVVRYSTKDNKVLWSKKINYQTEELKDFGGVTTLSSFAKSSSLDNNTGEPLWQINNTIAYVSQSANIAIGYKSNTASQKEANKLRAFDLKTGATLWERQISREFGINTIGKLNDSMLLVSAAGLHTISLKTGKGWDYSTRTGKKNYTTAVAVAGVGVVAAALLGSAVMPGGPDIVRNVVSNVLRDSTAFYLASVERLTKVDAYGNVMWTTELPEKETSKSLLIKRNDNVILINLGYANMGQRQLNAGKPFIARFSCKDGQQLYKTNIDADDKTLKDFNISGDEIFFVFEDKIEKYSLKDGALLGKQSYDLNTAGNQKFFLGTSVFVKQGNKYVSLTESAPEKLFIYTEKDQALVIDHSLKLLEQITLQDFYITYHTTDDLIFIKKQKQTLVVDKKGIEKAHFDAAGKAVLLGDKLYTATDSSIFEVDLSSLMK